VKHNKGQHINQWKETNMKMAVQEFKRGVTGLRQLAHAWNVPKSTLQRRVGGIVSGTDHTSGRKCVVAYMVSVAYSKEVNKQAKTKRH